MIYKNDNMSKTAKTKIEIHKLNNDTNIDKKIIMVLSQHGIANLQGIRSHLNADYNRSQTKRGYSEASIRRRIGHLLKWDEIRRVKPEELISNGMDVSDNRIVYFTLKTTSDSALHIEKIFKLIESQKQEEQKLALSELYNYKHRYIGLLNADRLGKLIEKLEIDNDEIRSQLLDILFDRIVVGKVELSLVDKNNLLEILQDLLKKYQSDPKYSGGVPDIRAKQTKFAWLFQQ